MSRYALPPLVWAAPGAAGNWQSFLNGWFSTTVNYEGDLQLEEKIATEVAGLGKQVGILNEAVLELAGRRGGTHGLDRLEKLVDRINKLKERHRSNLEERVADSFQSLSELDPVAAKRLLDELGRSLPRTQSEKLKKA